MFYNKPMPLPLPTLTEACAQIVRGELSPLALTRACLERIEQHNPDLNACITITADLALEQARQAGVLPGQTSKPLPTLAGIPLSLKDMYETKGIRTTAGSKFFADYVPAEDASVVRKVKDAGAVILAKTNLHEIALGVTNINPHFGVCRNPWDTTRISGGSSGGSAVAVASGMCLGALGTDTGGSIRIPASLCGVVGLKPTHGRVSLRGVIPLSWNLDHAGPLARTARDAALLLQVIAGHDPGDPVSCDLPVYDYLAGIEDGVRDWRVTLAVGEYIEESDPEVLAAVRAAARVFERLGARLEEVEMSWLREAALANGLMTQADAAAYHRARLAEHPDWFGADVRQRLQRGAAYTSTEYVLARRTQAETRRRFEQFFAEGDILLLPATPISAPPIEGADAIEQARRLTRFTAAFNLAGLPAMSLPCGFTAEGLPIGLQIVSRPWAEAAVLRAGCAYEQATEWHLRWPDL